MVRKLIYFFYKGKYWYYRILLRIFYHMKPNKDGIFDLKSYPSSKNAIMKLINT